MAQLLASVQLGYGIKRGAEAAVHGAHLFLNILNDNELMLKLDFMNTFNTVRRDKILSSVKDFVPMLLPFVHLAYSTKSSLFWGDNILESAGGVQQRDLLGLLLFFVSIHQLTTQLKVSFLCCIWMMVLWVEILSLSLKI